MRAEGRDRHRQCIQYALALDKMLQEQAEGRGSRRILRGADRRDEGFREEKRKYFDMMYKIADDVTK